MNFEVVMSYIVIGLIAGFVVWQALRIKAKEREAEEKEQQMLANMTAEEQAAYWKGKYEREKARDNNNWVFEYKERGDYTYANIGGKLCYDDDD